MTLKLVVRLNYGSLFGTLDWGLSTSGVKIMKLNYTMMMV
jgi:hypothetical protein